MAIRMLRIEGDPILRKVSREVTELTDNIKTLINACEENNVKTRVIKVVIDECEGKDNKAHKQQAK